MTCQPKSSSLSQKVHPLHTCIKKYIMSNMKSMLVIFLTMRKLNITNLFLQAKQLSRVSTGRFCNVWESKSAINIQNSRTRTGWLPWQCASSHSLVSVASFGPSKLYCGSHHPHVCNLASCDFLFLRMKSQLLKSHFQDVSEIQGQSPISPHTTPKSHFQCCVRQWLPAGSIVWTQKEVTVTIKKGAHDFITDHSRNFWICPSTMHAVQK